MVNKIRTPVARVVSGNLGFAVGRFESREPFHTLRPQGSPEWLLIYCEAGGAFFNFPGGHFQTQPGDAVLLKPGFPHDYGCLRGGEVYRRSFASFKPHDRWLPLFGWPEKGPGLLHLWVKLPGLRSKVCKLMAQARLEHQSARPRREAFAINSLERLFLILDAENPNPGTKRLDSRIAAALDYMHAAFAQPLSVGQIAKRSGLSVSRFSYLFKLQGLGTPQQYLEQRRLSLAVDLLRFSSQPIKEIARQVGFADAFYFSLRFKRLTGYCPRQYRQVERQRI